MRDDDSIQRWGIPDIPYERLMSVVHSHVSHYSPTKLGIGAVTTSYYRLKVRVGVTVGCKTSPSVSHPRLGSERVKEFKSNAPPQLQLIVVDGLQYAVLAKCVNGARASICAVLSVVIDCRLTVEARTSPMDARRKMVGSQTMMFWKGKKMELEYNQDVATVACDLYITHTATKEQEPAWH
jgi:hypothetical protein